MVCDRKSHTSYFLGRFYWNTFDRSLFSTHAVLSSSQWFIHTCEQIHLLIILWERKNNLHILSTNLSKKIYQCSSIVSKFDIELAVHSFGCNELVWYLNEGEVDLVWIYSRTVHMFAKFWFPSQTNKSACHPGLQSSFRDFLEFSGFFTNGNHFLKWENWAYWQTGTALNWSYLISLVFI